MAFIEINSRSPVVEFGWLQPFFNQFNIAHTIRLKVNHLSIPENFMDLTPKLKSVPVGRRKLTEVMTLPKKMTRDMWEQLVRGHDKNYTIVLEMHHIH